MQVGDNACTHMGSLVRMARLLGGGGKAIARWATGTIHVGNAG